MDMRFYAEYKSARKDGQRPAVAIQWARIMRSFGYDFFDQRS